MKAKISKAQLEVWEWKAKAYEEIKNIPLNFRIDYIYSKTDATIAEINNFKESNKVKK